MKFCSACDLAAHVAIEAGVNEHGYAWFEMCEPCHERYLDERVAARDRGNRWWAIPPGHDGCVEFTAETRHLFASRRMRIAMQLETGVP